MVKHHSKQYSLTIIPDEESEPFSVSICQCKVCKEINAANQEWDSFTPKNRWTSSVGSRKEKRVFNFYIFCYFVHNRIKWACHQGRRVLLLSIEIW